ncbi:hypothetical protein [Magnetococcus sp. PR-3]|uniref:hypothetical protein n=1 Tax=Magnetococcus sp. PR-3 TaxID=3120355 RepID=UPI002FCE04F6
MTLPVNATKQYLDAASKDPKQARSELASFVDKFNALLSVLAPHVELTLGDGLKDDGAGHIALDLYSSGGLAFTGGKLKIKAGSVSQDMLASEAVGAQQIANRAVGLAALATGTPGKGLGWGPDGDPEEIETDTSGMKVFTTSGTFSASTGPVTVMMVGGGAGGEGYTSGSSGGGGGGGEIKIRHFSSISSSVAVAIGGGGAGGAGFETLGANGGESSFGSYLSAAGGIAGTGAGSGGVGSSISMAGGNTSNSGLASIYGDGGVGGSGTGGGGGGGIGDGGDGGGSNSDGIDASGYGAGGGGCGLSGARGGNGSDGLVIIFY